MTSSPEAGATECSGRRDPVLSPAEEFLIAGPRSGRTATPPAGFRLCKALAVPWGFGGHAVPVIAALVALTWLFLVADRGQRWWRRAAILVYALALCLAIGECALWLAGRLTGLR